MATVEGDQPRVRPFGTAHIFEGSKTVYARCLSIFTEYVMEIIQEALKDLLSGTIQDMHETEMDNHLGYDRYERSGESNYRNGTKPKTVRSKYGEFKVDVPQDCQSSFEPEGLPKRQKDIKGLSALFARIKRKYITDGTVNRCRLSLFITLFADCS